MSEQQVEAIVERVRAKLGALESTLEGFHGIHASAQSPNGWVIAQVDGSGALTGLRLDEAVCGLDARELAISIVTTAHDAARAAAADRVALMDSLRGSLR